MNTYTEKIEKSVSDAAKRINDIKAEDSLVFPIITDLHTDDYDGEYMQRLIPALKLINKSIEFDALINLGDNFSMLGRKIHISNDELKARFERVLTKIHETVNHPVINLNGNHDGIGTDFFTPDFWNDITKGKFGNTMAVYGEEGSYYYIDYDKANTRLVILSLPYDSDTESEMPTPLWGFGNSQIKWLKETALNTNKDIIILSHVPFYYKYMGDKEATLGVWTGNEAKVSYRSALCGWIEDLDEAVKVIEEYNSRTDTRLVACLSGHTHNDSMWLQYEERDGMRNPLPCKQVVTAATCLAKNVENNVGISIDVAVWTPTNGELNMIRIGDGKDRVVIL